jgi:hypothetical protein
MNGGFLGPPFLFTSCIIYEIGAAFGRQSRAMRSELCRGALANKNAYRLWVLLSRNEKFRVPVAA